MPTPFVSFLKTLPLKHTGDCSLLGIAPDATIYVEEIYGNEAWLAQHALRLDGTMIESIDEAHGENDDLAPLDLPLQIVKSKTCWHTMALNFAGPRHRGLRAPERTLDLVHPLTIQEKIGLARRYNLDIEPPLLLGIAESYVLAESQIVHPNLYFVCRRVRLAVALPEERTDDDGFPYDYETIVIYLAHFYERDQESTFSDVLGDLTETPLHRPMDCILYGDHLFIADGGADDRRSAIHVWHIDLPEEPTLTEEERLHKKLYG